MRGGIWFYFCGRKPLTYKCRYDIDLGGSFTERKEEFFIKTIWHFLFVCQSTGNDVNGDD